MTNVLAALAHARHGETDLPTLVEMLGEHEGRAMRKTLNRMARAPLGMVASRKEGGIRYWRLNEHWAAYEALRALLLRMGQAWPEYRLSAAAEPYLPESLAAARRRNLANSRGNDNDQI